MALLNDVKLISVAPAHCYLDDATGPFDGARKLWGKRGERRVDEIAELDRLCAELVTKLRISAIALEDALCDWQKKK